jgi:predicted MPP superfamily phosphohydrolase
MSGVHYAPFEPKPGVKNILLSHYPTGVDSFPQTKFDLVLAGHSHGGQVRIPFYGALIVPFSTGEYQLGLYNTLSGPLYVNAGIGYFFANIRFCCRPEITVVEV